jgi:hypothetical protein
MATCHRSTGTYGRRPPFAVCQDDGNRAPFYNTPRLVRVCLLFSLIATMVHQVSVHHKYELLSDVKGSPKEEEERTLQHSPVVPERRLVESMLMVDSHETHQKSGNFIPAPPECAKLAYFDGSIHHKLYEPVIRAFHSRGWSITEDEERAHVFWFDQPDDLMDYHRSIKPWQRINQIPNTNLWDDKDSMAHYINRYYEINKREPLHSFPESYVVHDPADLKRFQDRLLQGGGLDIPWVIKQPTVNRGKVRLSYMLHPLRFSCFLMLLGVCAGFSQGVTIVGPHAEELHTLLNRTPGEEDQGRLVVQRYICDEMTYNERKFDFRVFWMVASVDPLIVLYHTRHNYVRIGHAKYDESNFNDTKSHLTTHTFGANERKATWDEFKAYIEEFQAIQGSRLAHLSVDPFAHVQNQIMQILAVVVDAFRNVTFHSYDFVSQNAFSLHAADMLIDNDLDVFLIELTDGPGKDEDYDFRIAMHNSIFGSVVDIFEDVTARQVLGHHLDVQDMKRRGVLGDFEVIYNQDWRYEYFDYETRRVKEKQGCDRSNQAPVNDKVPLEKVVARAATTALPNNISSKGVDWNVIPSKLFYMEGRTRSNGEMVTRSFRRNGWTPVDFIDMAQIVYDSLQPTTPINANGLENPPIDRGLQHWQFYNWFPVVVEESLHGTSNLERYMDSWKQHSCKPILYKGRDFSVHTYVLVVSWDPLIAYYHDGYLNIPYNSLDEIEFLTLREDGAAPDNYFWRGSWKIFKPMLEAFTSTLSTSPVGDRDPYGHIRNQLKHSLAQAVDGLALDLSLLLKEFKNTVNASSLPNFYTIYNAAFQVDRNLNTYLSGLRSWNVAYAESYQEIVDLNDDLYGAAFNLLEVVNATLSNAKRSNIKVTTEDLEKATNEVVGGYELLIHKSPNMKVTSIGVDSNNTSVVLWKYEYEAQGAAKNCSVKG